MELCPNEECTLLVQLNKMILKYGVREWQQDELKALDSEDALEALIEAGKDEHGNPLAAEARQARRVELAEICGNAEVVALIREGRSLSEAVAQLPQEAKDMWLKEEELKKKAREFLRVDHAGDKPVLGETEKKELVDFLNTNKDGLKAAIKSILPGNHALFRINEMPS